MEAKKAKTLVHEKKQPFHEMVHPKTVVYVILIKRTATSKRDEER
jgi:hypothetical protein